MHPIASYIVALLVFVGTAHAEGKPEDKPSEATARGPQVPKPELTQKQKQKLSRDDFTRKRQEDLRARKSSQGEGESAVAKAWREADI